jgi:sporulation protein YlmC with PRC-barrel domain
MEQLFASELTASQLTPAHPLIESDSVEGTAVFGMDGHKLGKIKRLVVEKLSGKVVYVVMSFGGFFGFGDKLFPIPWERLKYDPTLAGFRLDITDEQLRTAPSLGTDENQGWTDREREKALHDHYEVPPYWGI